MWPGAGGQGGQISKPHEPPYVAGFRAGLGIAYQEWLPFRNAFLIRVLEAVLASYVVKREAVTLADIGLPQQVALFERIADHLGYAPPVVESNDILADPKAMLIALCTACGIAFDPAMLVWPKGRRATDGVWAPAWYDKVELSTAFGQPRVEASFADLPDRLKPIAEQARPLYERLFATRLRG